MSPATVGLPPPVLPPQAAEPVPPATIVEPVAVAAEAGHVRRIARRSFLPEQSPGRLVLPDRTSVFVTLRDISRSGCCLLRRGELALKTGDEVRIEIWREDIQTKASLTATVRWCHQDSAGSTRVGLHFCDPSLKTHRLIESYLERSLAAAAL